MPDRTAFVLEHQSNSSLGNERVETDGDQRWAASDMNHSFRVNPLVEGFVIEKVVVVVQFEI